MFIKKLFIFIGLSCLTMSVDIFAGSFLPYPVPIVFKNETQSTFQLCTNQAFPPIIQEGQFTFPQTVPPGSFPFIGFTTNDERGCYNGTSCLYMVMYYGTRHDCQIADPIIAMVVDIGARHGEATTCYASTISTDHYKCHAFSDSNAVTITIENKK